MASIFTLLQASFLRSGLPPPSPSSFTILNDAKKAGWGALLLQGRCILCCVAGLWPASLWHGVRNTLELEALGCTYATFRPWIFGSTLT